MRNIKSITVDFENTNKKSIQLGLAEVVFILQRRDDCIINIPPGKFVYFRDLFSSIGLYFAECDETVKGFKVRIKKLGGLMKMPQDKKKPLFDYEGELIYIWNDEDYLFLSFPWATVNIDKEFIGRLKRDLKKINWLLNDDGSKTSSDLFEEYEKVIEEINTIHAKYKISNENGEKLNTLIHRLEDISKKLVK